MDSLKERGESCLRSAERKIPSSLAETVDPARAALFIWDMEYATGPNAFNYKEMLPKLQELSGLARRVEVKRVETLNLEP